MLKHNEILERLADGERKWFVNLTNGNVVDALGDRVGALRKYPATWRELTAAEAKALAFLNPEIRVARLAELDKLAEAQKAAAAAPKPQPPAPKARTPEGAKVPEGAKAPAGD